MNCVIRHETPQDIAAIHQLNIAAFNGKAEATLVDLLRQHGIGILSLAGVQGVVRYQPEFNEV